MTDEEKTDGIDPLLRGDESQAAAPGVLAAIERVIGSAARVSLHESPSDHFVSPVISPSSDVVKEKTEGRERYTLLGEIARGGMGVVVRSHDNDLGRDVALKILRREVSTNPEIMRRFVEEAQIGGQLQHPGIVPIYELGLMADQRPFFAMKLVKGHTLAARFAEVEDSGRRQLLDVFEAVCQTMAYAHTRGVIHRDLKPANVMVGAFGEVQVVDWGLAKVLAAGGVADEKRAIVERSNVSIIETVRATPGSSGAQSLAGSVMGTPAYMPPEQARGEVGKLDQRSDVFSLGAILCELLTGEPPYTGSGHNLPGEAQLVLVQAANADLDDAFARLDDCDADAELVELCKQCLAPAPAARPRSARSLAKRMHEYLGSLEERARQAQIEAAETRARAVADRRANRLTLALGATVAIAVIGGGGSWAWRQREIAERAYQSEKAVLAALSDASVARGTDDLSLTLAHLLRARDSADTGAVETELIGRIETRLADVRADLHDRDVRSRLDEIRHMEWASVFDRTPEREVLSRQDEAYADAFTELGIDVTSGSESSVADTLSATGQEIELASALDTWVRVRIRLDNGVSERSRRLLRIAMEADGDPWRRDVRAALLDENDRALGELARAAPDRDLTPVTAIAMATVLSTAGREGDAVDLLRRAQRLDSSDYKLLVELGLSPASTPDDAVRFLTAAIALRPASAETLVRLGKALYRRKLFDESVTSCERALEVDANMPKVFVAAAHSTMAEAFFAQGKFERAFESFRAAIEAMPAFAGTHFSLGRALMYAGEFKAGIESARRAIELDPKWAQPFIDIGVAQGQVGRSREAIASFDRAIELDPENSRAFYNRGSVQQELGDLAGAHVSFVESVRLDATLPEAQQSLGNTWRSQRKFDAALASYRAAIALQPDFVIAHHLLADTLFLMQEFELAIEHYETAIRINPDYAEPRNGLAWALVASGRADLMNPRAAVRHANHAILLAPERNDFWNTLGVSLYRAAEYDASLEALFQSMSLGGEHADNWLFVAMNYVRLDEPDEAFAWYEKAVDWRRVRGGAVVNDEGFFQEARETLGLPDQ